MVKPSHTRPNCIHRTPYECEVTRQFGYAYCPVYQVDGVTMYGWAKWRRSPTKNAKLLKGRTIHRPKYWIIIKLKPQGNGQSDGF